ncbi:MAG: hypothetical protein WBH57_12900 [Anaerolineae bacterium]
MRKARWLAFFLALGLLLPLFGILGGRLARPASAGTSPAAISSPILGWFIDIWVDTVDNYNPAVAYNGLHDEYLVVWWNDRGATRDIYARRVGSDGTVKSWFSVVSNPNKWNWLPDVAYSPAQDEYLIVYAYNVTSTDYDLWARRIKWDGSWMSAEFPIDNDVDKDWYPALAYNSQNDEFLVVYEKYVSSTRRDIEAQRVRASDGVLLSWRNIAGVANQGRRLPDVAYNVTRNEYLIAYTMDPGIVITPTLGVQDIYGKVASANLGTLSSEIHICDDAYDQDSANVAAGPDEYLVVWEDGALGTSDYDIYGRRVSGAGTPQGASGGFPIAAATANLHVEPDVAYGAGYGYLVTWRYASGTSSGNDLYGRHVMPGQDSATGNEFAIDSGADSQRSPALACAPSGDCLVVEEDNWPAGDYEIRGRFVMPHRVYLPMVLRNY